MFFDTISDGLHYLHKDHLGSIVSITNAKGFVEEMSYDPWGRRRNPTDLTFNNVPTQTILSRGYTGHEHLDVFNLINMNGRVYDPALGMFISPDNYVQAPDNSQSYNRYSYCLNNPLLYTDPTGEYFIIDDIIAGAIGGVVNLAVNAFQGNLGGHGFWGGVGRGFAAFGSGAVGGVGALYPEFGGWVWGGATVGATNAWLGGATSAKDIAIGAGVGVVSSVAGGAAGQWAGQHIGGVLINGFNVTSPVVKGAITGTIGGAAGGYTGGFVGTLVSGGSIETASQVGWSSALTGAFIGTGSGAVGGYRYAKQNNISPWTGKSNNSITIGEGMTSNPEKGWMGVDKISKDLGSGKFEPKNLPEESWYTDSKLMNENAQWIEGKMLNRSIIYDRGSVGNNSQYYNMEVGRTMNYPVIRVTPYYNNSQSIRILILSK